MRVVPKYKKDYGPVGTSEKFIQATPEELKKIKEKLQPNKEEVYGERSRIIARLDNRMKPGYTYITAKKHIPADIKLVDAEIWSQMGDLLLECINKLEKSLDCHDFRVSLHLGKVKKISEEEKREFRERHDLEAVEELEKGSKTNELVLTILPMYNESHRWGGRKGRPTRKKDNKVVGTMENERLAEKTRDPEAYYAKWKNDPNYLENKRKALKNFYERERESIWKQPVLYLAFASGAGIVLLVWVILTRKRNKKEKQ